MSTTNPSPAEAGTEVPSWRSSDHRCVPFPTPSSTSSSPSSPPPSSSSPPSTMPPSSSSLLWFSGSSPGTNAGLGVAGSPVLCVSAFCLRPPDREGGAAHQSHRLCFMWEFIIGIFL